MGCLKAPIRMAAGTPEIIHSYIADTEAERPASALIGEDCYCKDSKKTYTCTSLAPVVWEQTGGSAAGGPHAHPISDVTDLQTGLDGKALTSHTHDAAAIATGVLPIARLATGTPDGTKFIRDDGTLQTPAGGGGGLQHDSIIMPPFFRMANLTAVTAFATNTSYFIYLGKVSSAISTLDIRNRVTAAGATITWAEVGVFTGAAPAFGGNASLTRRGFTNVAATFNSTGLKTTTVALTGVTANAELWLAFGSQATTPFQVRGGLADDLQVGWYATFAGRISLAASPQAVTLASATLVPPWCVARL